MYKPRKRNAKPEAKLYPSVQAWLSKNNFSCHRVEAAARYSVASKCYRRTETPSGFSDFAGVTPDGQGAFIEVKSLGKKSSLMDHQKAFLSEKILHGAFAAVVDSVEDLQTLWTDYLSHEPGFKRMHYLLERLPKKRVKVAG